MPAPDPLHIIYLEDSLDDLELLRRRFTQELPRAVIHHASSRAELHALFGQITPDAILSDFAVPDLPGFQALTLAKEVCPEVPFIFLSGTLDEEQAIAALQAGACDYVLKDRPKRLASAIHRAIAEAAQKKATRAAEAQLLRAQRLENIGLLAAGIAHDFNNMLAPVLLASPMLRDRVTEPSDKKLVDTIEQSATRGAYLVRQILGFAQGAGGAATDINLVTAIRDVVSVLERTFPKNIHIEMRPTGQVRCVRASVIQIQQILLNLAVNARDAMVDGGTLQVSVANVDLDQTRAAAMKGASVGQYVHVVVSDTGPGIPAEIIDRIWDPFFTTKSQDHGTGLGLSTVRGIVEQLGGFVRVSSFPGRGANFHVYLPALYRGEAADDSASARSERLTGNGELIVVVDDEQDVRDVTATTLSRAGYRVATAEDGAAALAIVSSRLREIAAVMTDVNMPNMDGVLLSKVIRTFAPKLPILAVTGIADEAKRTEMQPHFSQLLVKPFRPDALLQTVRRVVCPSDAPLGAPVLPA